MFKHILGKLLKLLNKSFTACEKHINKSRDFFQHQQQKKNTQIFPLVS